MSQCYFGIQANQSLPCASSRRLFKAIFPGGPEESPWEKQKQKQTHAKGIEGQAYKYDPVTLSHSLKQDTGREVMCMEGRDGF